MFVVDEGHTIKKWKFCLILFLFVYLFSQFTKLSKIHFSIDYAGVRHPLNIIKARGSTQLDVRQSCGGHDGLICVAILYFIQKKRQEIDWNMKNYITKGLSTLVKQCTL